MTATINPSTPGSDHKFIQHTDTWLSLDELGRSSRPYLPTYAGVGQTVNEFHKYILDCPTNGVLVDLGLPGWLQKADALKLYELGFFAPGDILEFGTYRGLSTFILAKAIEASRRQAEVVTMDLDPAAMEIAKSSLAARSVDSFVSFQAGDANATCLALISDGREFSFAFIDHSHAYEPMALACEALARLLTVGSFCLFHDFNDSRNTSLVGVGESGVQYGVYSAVQNTLNRQQFEFYGIFGCCGLYRKIA